MSATSSSDPDAGSTAPRPRPGGRTARVGAAVVAATLDLLGEGGLADLTVDAVAERAGVHKTTIYRRWGSRERLVGAALATQSAESISVPDTGDLRGDLVEVARAVAANLASPLGRALAQTVVGHGDDPEIARLAEGFWSSRFDRTAPVVERAVRRGELAEGTDPRLVVELVVAPVWFRSIVVREPVDDDHLEVVVDVALAGLGAPAADR